MRELVAMRARISQVLLAALACAAIGSLEAQAQSPEETPASPKIGGKVLTVHGPITPSEVGRTLMHEHIFVNFQLAIPDTRNHATEEQVAREKLSLANLWAVRAGS